MGYTAAERKAGALLPNMVWNFPLPISPPLLPPANVLLKIICKGFELLSCIILPYVTSPLSVMVSVVMGSTITACSWKAQSPNTPTPNTTASPSLATTWGNHSCYTRYSICANQIFGTFLNDIECDLCHLICADNSYHVDWSYSSLCCRTHSLMNL